MNDIAQIRLNDDFSRTFHRLRKRLTKQVSHAIKDYNMIEDGDFVLVCVSGGKDSYTLLDILLHLQKRAPIDFKILALNVDQKQPGFPQQILPEYFSKIGVEYRIEEENTYAVVQEKTRPGKTTCALCSRLRRGIIYRVAKEVGANKIALGHHREDLVETLFLNMFFGARLRTMPPKLITDDEKHIVIRPLSYCSEPEIARFAKHKGFPIIPCNLCGSQQLQRQKIKEMLHAWEKEYPGRIENIFRSLQNANLSHLADRDLYDFANLKTAPIDEA